MYRSFEGSSFALCAVAKPHRYSSEEIFISAIGISLLLNHSLGEWFSPHKKEAKTPNKRAPLPLLLLFLQLR
jgi:hypothetical protein